MLIMVCYDGKQTGHRVVKLAQEHATMWKANMMVVVKAVERDTPLKRAYV